MKTFDLFSTNAPVLYPLKTSENFRFSDVFSGYGSGAFVENELICLEIIVKYQTALFLELLLVCPDAVRQKAMTGTTWIGEKTWLAWSLRQGWLMLAWRDKLKGSLCTFVKNINLGKNWYDTSIKLSPYYDRSKLFWRKTLVNVQNKYFRENFPAILQQQIT